MELKIAIIFTVTAIGISTFTFNFLPAVWMKIVVVIVFAIFSWWIGNFLRKKKKEAVSAELGDNKK